MILFMKNSATEKTKYTDVRIDQRNLFIIQHTMRKITAKPIITILGWF